MTTETHSETSTNTTETVEPTTVTEQADETTAETEQTSEPDTFARSYVEKLRAENAEARVKAKAADDLAQRLHVELVRATGKLADPTDLGFDAAHLEDPEKLAAAVDELLAHKPHLKARRIGGDVGQGQAGAVSSVSLLGMLRDRA
ncbi:hypothetical protein [Gordonia sp. WA4-43]|uniref:hypothetical protein n=1 Tax=Gordonia sp. WA4-43 TaxID=2878678 RepID=UPI001CFBBEAB|nr:hypothetical protein [Gordonia sp. WA4-43]UCZ90443.1 hypothetical protein LEL84_01715 [Gordonia sp. WA4-43]